VARKLVGAVNPFPETERNGILEKGRSAFQIIAFFPLLLVVFSRRAGKLHLLSVALLSAYLLMSVLTMGTIRYRFPLIWIELLSVAWAADLGWRRFSNTWSIGAAPGNSGPVVRPRESAQVGEYRNNLKMAIFSKNRELHQGL
jgi:hypothetical protein